MSKPIFTTLDPWGNQVALYDDRYRHAIEGGHPEIEGRILEVQQTIETPKEVRQNPQREEVKIFISETITAGFWTGGHYVVPVGYNSTTAGTCVGTVRSAWITSSTPDDKKEKVIWSQPKKPS